MQVKFRGKRVDGCGWVEGNLIKHIDSLGELWLIEEYIADYTYKKHQVYQESIGMFTGLTDKNGKEIYGAVGENGGDIVKWDDCSGGKYWRFAQVKISPDICFDCKGVIGQDNFENTGRDHCFRYGNFIYKDTENHLIVIGNATDNPELLNQ